MTSVYPSHRQLSAPNLQKWIEKFGPLTKVIIYNPESHDLPHELELRFGE